MSTNNIEPHFQEVGFTLFLRPADQVQPFTWVFRVRAKGVFLSSRRSGVFLSTFGATSFLIWTCINSYTTPRMTFETVGPTHLSA